MIKLPEPTGYIRKDQLQKVQQGWAYLCDVGPEPRADKQPIHTDDQLKQAGTVRHRGSAEGTEVMNLNPFSGFKPTETFNGLKVYLSHDMPNRVLSKDVPVSEEMRTQVDAWMLGFFGTTNMLADGAYIVSEVYGTVMMNPRTYQKFKLQMGAMYDHQRPSHCRAD